MCQVLYYVLYATYLIYCSPQPYETGVFFLFYRNQSSEV